VTFGNGVVTTSTYANSGNTTCPQQNFRLCTLKTTGGSGSSTLNSGLLAHWKLDEGSGTTASDASGNGRTGTVNGGATWTTGTVNGALSFDGVNDHVAVPTTIGDRAAFSVALWFKTSSTQIGKVWAEDDSTTGTPYIFLSVNENVVGDAEFGYRDNNGVWTGLAVGASNLNNGQWHLLVAVQRSKSDRDSLSTASRAGSARRPPGP
jgi:hypothetical protein